MTDFTDDHVWAPIAKGAEEFDKLRKLWRQSVDEIPLPAPGEYIDERFEVVKELGRGGFGCVFEVRHRHLEQRFALKLLTPQVAQRPGWKERFREEARATSQLGHPNIIFITDFGTCEKFGTYFAMEYLSGVPLSELIRKKPLSVDEAVGLLRAMGSALDAAHDREIVHCDLKPANIFRVGSAENPRWKLLDFGASSIVMDAWETQTLYGTPLYMAPEQAMGTAVDRRADVFSLAVVLYEALTGQQPWPITMWLHATPRWRAERPPEPPSKHVSVPRGWDTMILRALDVDPANRPQRAGMFTEALISAFERRPPAQPVLQPLSPETVVELSSEANFRSSISPGEFFIISRIEQGVTLAELMRLCTGLPFDVDATLRSMIERGYVVAAANQRTPDARNAMRPRSTQPYGDTEGSPKLDLDTLLVRVNSLRAKGNFLGALETVNAAMVTWPEIGELHYRHALLLREYGKPSHLVRASLRRAVELEPENREFREALAKTEGRV